MAMVLDEFISVFTHNLLSLANDEIRHLMGVGGEIQRLRTRLERMLPVLADAETRRLQENAIKCWVQHLRDIVYAAEDTIELYKIECEKVRKSNSCSFSCFIHYTYRRHNFGNKIKDLNLKLDDIIRDIPILHLSPTRLSDHTVSRKISRKTSSVLEPNLIGKTIEDDSTMLIDLLTSNENQKNHQKIKISVFAILGMGGIGKTTLAQKIFNNDRLRAKFSHMVWVCVSQDFSETELLRSIIIRVGGIIPGDLNEKEDLEPMLYDIVKGKKFFLVLDDVWDAKVWENLLYKLLQSVAAGSRVVVTTRHESVAMSMRATYFHQVQKLSDEEGWSLLYKMVFDQEETQKNNPLRDIGMKIVKKCDGLPLAIKAIAGVLRNKGRRAWHWEEVLENPAWSLSSELQEGVMGALYLSFNDLPSHLKQCFLYFALFPEDFEFRRAYIVRLWSAEGFIEEKENVLMEELGKEYWKELVDRNLLEPHDDYYDLSRAKMHDLLHSLAQYLASDECFCRDLKVSEVTRISFATSWPMNLRRANMKNGEAVAEVIKKQALLRTLLVPFQRNFTKDTTKNLRMLRILSLTNSFFEKLPDSIGGLVLLRYLDISESKMISEIPESIGNLENLQFLVMSGCKNLRKLPNSITNLQNLRCLDLCNTGVQIMPAGMGKLQNLAVLYGFFVSGSNIGELGSLSKLNSLSVFNIENASTTIAAKAAAAAAAEFRTKTFLVYLKLHCTTRSSSYEQEDIKKIGDIFEELCPPLSLQFLIIEGYFGLEFSSWLNQLPSSFLPNLRRVELKNCVLCKKLPPLGLLPQLDCLWIVNAPAVKSIGPELFGSRPHSSFPKLETLHLENLPNWEEWHCLNEEAALLPCLGTLAIEGCPKLKSLPRFLNSNTASLKYLWIEGADSLKEVENFMHVIELRLIQNSCMETVTNLPFLKKLWIEDCEKLKDVESLDTLQFLDLQYSRMSSLPEWLVHVGTQELKFTMLRRLVIKGNSRLLSRCLVGAQDWHKIRQMQCVDAYDYDEPKKYIHYTKSPFSFDMHYVV